MVLLHIPYYQHGPIQWGRIKTIHVEYTMRLRLEKRLVADMIGLVRQYGRYGYRRIATLLRQASWKVKDKIKVNVVIR